MADIPGLSYLAPNRVLDFARQYLRQRRLLGSEYFIPDGPRETQFHSEESFWQAILAEDWIFDTRMVRLNDFLLLQWVPLSPGRYFTAEAEVARTEAEDFIEQHTAQEMIYDPFGKTRMIRGGVGCLRLASKVVDGERLWFVCATTSGVAHRGIVLAVPENIYRQIAQSMEHDHGIVADVSGQVRYWAQNTELPFHYVGLPSFYLYVENLAIKGTLTRPESISVSGAITFAIQNPGDTPPGMYFSYAYFNPCLEDSIETATQLLTGYVRHDYDGTILTDFDESSRRFDAQLPVREMMNPDVEPEQLIQNAMRTFGYLAPVREVEHLIREVIGEVGMTKNYFITGDANVIGDHNQVITTINKGLMTQDLQNLGKAFAELKVDIIENNELLERQRNQAVRALDDAEEEAASPAPDREVIEQSLQRVKDIMERAGQVFDAALGWGVRLATLARLLQEHFPGDWPWLQQLLGG